MDEDFGIIPWPKYDETIDNYYANVDAGCNLFIVPVTNPDPEKASVILEALAYESYLTVIPTYYDVVLTTKFTRDAESVEMLDIIRAGRVFDIGYYFFDNSNDLNTSAGILPTAPTAASLPFMRSMSRWCKNSMQRSTKSSLNSVDSCFKKIYKP